MEFLTRLLTWWNSQTLGTQLFTLRKGKKVGEDAEGNKYFENKDGSRRWVIYNGEMEASRITPEWHGWLHHTFQQSPTEKTFSHKSWEVPHQQNLTGSPEAYIPAGSLRRSSVTRRQDYIAWVPNSADNNDVTNE